MKIAFNPLTGRFDLIGDSGTVSLLNVKGQVATVAGLPSSGNTIGDVWQVVADLTFRVWDGAAWDNLGTLQGPAGQNIELQKTATHIQWRVVGGTWANLVALSEITGPPGTGGSSFGGYGVGNWIVPTRGSLGAGQALTANQIALMPVMFDRVVTASDIAVTLTTAAASASFQLAFYGSANGLHTGTPIFSTSSLSAGTTGNISTALASATTFQPGVIYWQAINADGTPTFLSVAANNAYHCSILGSSNLAQVMGTTGTTFHSRVITSQPFGTWPDLTGVSSTIPTSNQRRVPVFAFLVSALP